MIANHQGEVLLGMPIYYPAPEIYRRTIDKKGFDVLFFVEEDVLIGFHKDFKAKQSV